MRAALLRAHFVEIAAHTIVRADRLARNHLLAHDDRLDVVAQIDDHVATLDALDDARDQLADTILKGLDYPRALGVADALEDHLLGFLRADAAELDGLQRFGLGVADLRLGVVELGAGEQRLALGRLEVLVLVIDHRPLAEGFVFAGLAVDVDHDVPLGAVVLLARRGERGFERLEDDLRLNAFFVRDDLDHHQHVLVHAFVALLAVR